MKVVMGFTKHGEKCHLVNGDDLAVALCGVRIDHHVRQYGNGPLVLWADHWRDGAVGAHKDTTCTHCLDHEQEEQRRAKRIPHETR